LTGADRGRRIGAISTRAEARGPVEPDLAAELDRLIRFATTDDVAVRLKDTDDFLSRRHFLTFEDPPLGLGNDLLDSEND